MIFFLYGIDFIPFDSLDFEIYSDEEKFFKTCKIFKCKNLSKQFFGIKKEVLPLAAILLGNDYVSMDEFKDFLLTLKVPEALREKFSNNKPHLRIEVVLRWLGKQKNLDCAVAKVLHAINSDKRQVVLELIEVILNQYLSTSAEMMFPLGFTEEHVSYFMKSIPKKFYKFQNPPSIEVELENRSDESFLSSDDLIDSSTRKIVDTSIVKSLKKPDLKNFVPSWFMIEYNVGNLPCHFMDMITRQLIITSAQIEDYSYPSCFNISLKIIGVIFKLISNGTTGCDVLKYYGRGTGSETKQYELDTKKLNLPCNLPKLETLVRLPAQVRKQILDFALELSDNKSVLEFPPSWRLYIVIIKYWLKNSDEKFGTKYHLYSLIFAMILHVIKKVIKNGRYFEQEIGAKNDDFFKKEKKESVSGNLSVKDALQRVNKKDCLFVLPFFDPLYLENYKDFNLSIIHAYSLLQNCMKCTMHLNRLLGCPYPSLNVADFYSGTLNYNLYKHFAKYENLNNCVLEIFGKSPTILQLFVSIADKF